MSKETRERIAFRMQPETRRRIEQWYAADNCQSKNEFIEKAVNFYVDYLGMQDNTTLLPMAIMSAIDGRLSRLEDYSHRAQYHHHKGRPRAQRKSHLHHPPHSGSTGAELSAAVPAGGA